METNWSWWKRFRIVEERNKLKWGVEGVKTGWGIYRRVGDEI
jgi:hypothetical protein